MNFANNAPTGRFAPPPVESKPFNADEPLAYIGVATSSHAAVALLKRFVLILAPRLGSVVLIHTEPVGRPTAEAALSVLLYVGTLVCG